MHETVIARKVIEDARALAGAEKGGKIKSITLEVGDLAHLPADELKQTLENFVDWKITVVGVKAKIECECGFRGIPNVLERGHDFCVYECPKCGRAPPLVSGEGIVIKEIGF